MNEQKIIFFILCGAIYFWFMVHRRFLKEPVEDNNNTTEPDTGPPPVVKEAVLNQIETKENTEKTKTKEKHVKRKIIYKKKPEEVVQKDTCSVSELFTKTASDKKNRRKFENMESSSNTIAVIGITVFLVILVINAALDVLKVREEEKLRLKLNPDGERRQSLAEFANKKSLRRESSKFSLQLFQIAESIVNGESENEETKNRREARPYTRGESTTSYFSDKKPHSENSAPASIGECSSDPKMVKRQSATKLIGARPVPMVRRSSFPALPLNPEVQALMLGNRQPSFDSDDEDGKGRRVRIIRRY